MGSKAATTKIRDIRVHLNEPVADAELTNAGAGTNWTNEQLLKHLNTGKNRLWDLIRTVKKDYFQVTGNTSLALTTTTRIYTLPSTFRELVYLKITTSGYEHVKFKALGQDTDTFKGLFADPNSYSGTTMLYYDLIGNERIILANFPPAALATEMGFVAWIDDYTLSASSTSDIRDEWSDYEETYAAREALLKDPKDERIAVMNEKLRELAPQVLASVAPRQVRDPEYVQEFEG